MANTGSNDVSILLGQGSGSSWTLIPGPRIKTDAGPVAVAVGDILGDGKPDLAVANQQANNVQVFPGVGGGFFNDQKATTYAVGQAPRAACSWATSTARAPGSRPLNAGSNTISLIGQNGVTQTDRRRRAAADDRASPATSTATASPTWWWATRRRPVCALAGRTGRTDA